MTIIKATKDNSRFISNPIVQGFAENDWQDYTLEAQFSGQHINIVSDSTATQLVSSNISSFDEGKTVFVKEGLGSSVIEGQIGTTSSIAIESYDVSAAIYDDITFNSATQETSPTDVVFNNDGTKMYIVGRAQSTVFQYTLSVPFDISSAVYDSVSFSVSGQATTVRSLAFSNTGNEMYVYGSSTLSVIYQYTLTTAFDLSTASYDSVSFSVSGQVSNLQDLAVNNDGTKLYIISSSTLYQYTLSTPFNISTATYDNVSFSVISQLSFASGLEFNDIGTKMTVSAGAQLYQYTLSTAFDLSSASYNGTTFNFSRQINTISNFNFNNNGTKLYAVYASTNLVYQYSIPQNGVSVDISSFALTETPSIVQFDPNIRVATCFESDQSRCISQDTEFLPVTASTTQFEIDDFQGPNLLLAGDNVVLKEQVSTPINISGVTYDSTNFNVNTSLESNAFTISNDGTKLYTASQSSAISGGTSQIHQFTLGTPYNLTTAVNDNVSFTITSQQDEPRGLAINPDGTRLYVIGQGADSVFQYRLDSALDLSTASYKEESFSFSGQGTNGYNITFNDTGTKMYILDLIPAGASAVYQYTLTTPFDVVTASYDSVSFSAGAQDDNPWTVDFNNVGTKMYIAGATSNSIYQYSLSTPFDVSTAVYDTNSFSFVNETTQPVGIEFSTDGAKMFMLDVNDIVYQYSVNGTVNNVTSTTATTADSVTLNSEGFRIDSAQYNEINFNSSSQDTAHFAFAFNNDGTKMYLLGDSTNNVHQYTLSVAFDLSNVTYDGVSFNVGTQTGSPRAITLNDTGTKMYISGITSADVFQYTLSVAFDLSNVTYDGVSFNVGTQTSGPIGLAFNNDGTKMYVLGNSTDSVHQYTLSVAFDLSNVTYDGVSFNASAQDTSPLGLAFNNDGTKMYVIGDSTDSVFQYTLSVAFDLSNVTYDGASFNVGTQESVPRAVAFNNDGTKMYVIGQATGFVYQYTTAFYNYTVNYAALSFTPISLTIPDRSITTPIVAKAWLGSTPIIGQDYTKHRDIGRRALQYRIDGNTGAEVIVLLYDLTEEA